VAALERRTRDAQADDAGADHDDALSLCHLVLRVLELSGYHRSRRRQRRAREQRGLALPTLDLTAQCEVTDAECARLPCAPRAGAIRLLAAAFGCAGGGDEAGGSPPPPATPRFAPAFGGEASSPPVKLVQHPTNDDRWYVVEQRRRVFTLLGPRANGARLRRALGT
jgi:hypothetical protein